MFKYKILISKLLSDYILKWGFNPKARHFLSCHANLRFTLCSSVYHRIFTMQKYTYVASNLIEYHSKINPVAENSKLFR